MVDKEKQIEEKAKEFCSIYINPTHEDCELCKQSSNGNCDALKKLKKFIKNYFPEDSVVLSKEEYKCLKSIEKSYDPFWFCAFGGCEGMCKECKDTCEMSIFVKERKETAEKILKEGGRNISSSLKAWIIEQFGVEIKE